MPDARAAAAPPPMPSAPERAKEFMLFGRRVPAESLVAGLHVVSTPIGNLKDISIRALNALAAADVVLAEDTRVSGKLLSHYGVATPMISYHDHNAARMRPQVMERLARGEAIALISDAGTPLVSDPGYRLVTDAIEAGFPVTAIPGASALLAALAIAGLPTDRFFFEGFLPPKSAARRARLKALAAIPGTLVLYESPGRAAEAVADAAAMLGARRAVVARELTKLHEEAIRGALPDVARDLAARDVVRGEIVILIAPAEEGESSAEDSEASLDALLGAALANVSLKQAVADVAARTGEPRRVVYARALALTGKS